ncbi:hypothetical protein [Rodentibacter trehalosifermentans]|uniref:hypothetical protein n=1 Tax=Rodentibacter trehalosifermentans TaxID=1908263 RepID=UPI0015C3BEDA|nr:hypothetical protein [Rodentibacter trehalosifermentans]
MKNVMKDAGFQSYAWNGLTGWLAWLGDQQNLMLISLALGIITALVNMYSKCQEGKFKRRQEERAEALFQQEMRYKEELHLAKIQQLKRGLRNE